MAAILNNFAVFEGGDGSGTTTQLALLTGRMASVQTPFFATCEPAGGQVGLLIRRALSKEISLLPETLARLFAADRGEHLYGTGGVAERCKRGELVVSDRYVLSSLVYQGIECGDELPAALNAPFPLPELLIYFAVNPETAQQRLKNRASLEIYEYLEFQQKVRAKYYSLLESWRAVGVRVAVVDASPGPEEVAEEVWGHISKMPILKR